MKMETRTKRPSFENYKSTLCHRVKEMGDLAFIVDVLRDDDIRSLYNKEWYRECFYTLAMVDYLSRINNLPICTDFDYLRKLKLEELLYPSSVLVMSEAFGNNIPKEEALKEAIPEFLHFNIVEAEIENVI